MSALRRTVRRAAIAAGCAVLAWGSVPIMASAHAFLVESAPADGERLATAPPQLRLSFSEGVAPDPVITVSPYGGAGGAPISLGPAASAAAGETVMESLPTLSAGVYVVSWEVISSADGHASAGTFSFSVGSGGQALPTSTSSTPIPWLEVVLQAALLVSVALVVGALAIGRRRDRATQRNRVLVAALIVSDVAALALLVVLIVRLRPASLTVTDFWRPLLTTSAGVAEVLTAMLALTGSVAVAFRRDRVALALVLGAVAAVALRAHPSAVRNVVVDIAVVVHIVVALLWAGGLFHLLRVAVRERGGRTDGGQFQVIMARYLRAAPITAGCVILTGVILAAAELRSVGALFDSGYGQVLLVKSALVAAAIIAALVARHRLTTQTAGATVPLRREAMTLVGVLGTAALLSAVAPPSPTLAAAINSPVYAAVPASPTHLHEAAFAGDLAVYLTVNPTNIVVYVRNFNYQAESAAVVSVTQSGGGSSPQLRLHSCGPGCTTATATWVAGINALAVTVRSTRWTGGVAAFSVLWPPQPANIEQLLTLITAMRTQAHVDVTEQVSSGTHKAGPTTYRLSGAAFVQGEPYGPTTTDLHEVTTPSGQRSLLVFLSGSLIWGRLTLDGAGRLATEQLMDQGHLIERTFSYPAG